MPNKYAELKLYYGLCSQDGCGEGLFDLTRTDDYSVKRITGVVKNIRRYLEPGYEWVLLLLHI